MNARSTDSRSGEFTGRHMLMIILAFFGVIITVNLIMATFATTTWSGLVVKNSYVASQQFNEKAEWGRAQAELGWKTTLAVEDATIRYRLADEAGAPVSASRVVATFRRPVSDAEDQTFDLERTGDGWVAPAASIHDGVWIVEIDADVGLAHPYRDVRRIFLRDGIIR